jgi:hypothetical protein
MNLVKLIIGKRQTKEKNQNKKNKMNKYLNYLNDNYFKEINYIYIKQSKTNKKKTNEQRKIKRIVSKV